MGPGLRDLIGHNVWATARLLALCRGLDAATLDATVPGTYGSILATLRHLVDAEATYLYRLTGAWPAHPWRGDDAVGLDVLTERAAVLATALERFLASDWDSERLSEGRGDGGEVVVIPAGVLLAQALHHANEHRGQVCTILGALGHEPPDVSALGYALATGRSTPTVPPSND